MNSNEINWKGGRVILWDLEDLSEDRPLIPAQLDHLKEDLGQIAYPNGRLIDIGWYPEFSAKGEFTVFVIDNENWDQPMAKEHGKSVIDLKRILARSIDMATGT